MADSTTNLDYGMEYYDTVIAKIKTDEALVVDGYASIAPATGLLENGDDTASLIPVGLVVGSVNRDNTTTGLTGDGTIKAVVKSGRMIKSKAVTGATAITDYGKKVYVTDNQTYTLTKPTTAIPVGWVKAWISATLCDIQLFTGSELLMLSGIPESGQINMGYLSAQSLGGTGALTVLTAVANKRVTLTSVSAYPQMDDAAVGGAQTFTVDIGGVSATGTLSLGFADCDDLVNVGVPVTQALTVAVTANQGDAITLELVASGTGFTDNTVAGFNIILNYTALPGS